MNERRQISASSLDNLVGETYIPSENGHRALKIWLPIIGMRKFYVGVRVPHSGTPGPDIPDSREIRSW